MVGTEAQTRQPDTSKLNTEVVLQAEGGETQPHTWSHTCLADSVHAGFHVPSWHASLPVTSAAHQHSDASSCLPVHAADRKAITMRGEVITYQRVYKASYNYSDYK